MAVGCGRRVIDTSVSLVSVEDIYDLEKEGPK